MASLTDIRVALADNLSSIAGLQQSAYMLSNPTPPTAEVMPSSIRYDRSMARGLDTHNLTVRVLVGQSSDRGAQKRLDGFLAGSGATSIKAAIESDTTLGGAASDLRVMECSGYRVYGREGNASVLGAEWQVEVVAKGTA